MYFFNAFSRILCEARILSDIALRRFVSYTKTGHSKMIMNLKTHFYTVFLELFSLAETEVGCGCTAFVHFQKYLLYIDDIHVFQRSPLIHYQTENKFYNLCLRSSKLRSIFASLKPSSLLLNVKLFIFRSTTLSIEVTFLIWAFSRRIPVKNSSSIRNPSISVRSLSS